MTDIAQIIPGYISSQFPDWRARVEGGCVLLNQAISHIERTDINVEIVAMASSRGQADMGERSVRVEGADTPEGFFEAVSHEAKHVVQGDASLAHQGRHDLERDILNTVRTGEYQLGRAYWLPSASDSAIVRGIGEFDAHLYGWGARYEATKVFREVTLEKELPAFLEQMHGILLGQSDTHLRWVAKDAKSTSKLLQSLEAIQRVYGVAPQIHKFEVTNDVLAQMVAPLWKEAGVACPCADQAFFAAMQKMKIAVQQEESCPVLDQHMLLLMHRPVADLGFRIKKATP